MELGIAGRTALVTGAAGGIGRAVASALADEGARIVLVDRDAERVAALVETLRTRGAEVLGLTVDVTDEAQVAGAVQAAVAAFDRLDLVVGCAGVSGPVGEPLEAVSLQAWEAVFAVNVTGSYLLLKHAIPALRASDAASVVLVASDSALVATAGMVPYCASKAAVLQLARAAAVELAGDGIRINAICPSIVDTPMSRGDLELTDGFAGQAYPVQTAAEVADQIVFLCSPRARPVNAAALVSDFGYSARSGFPA